MTSTCRAFALCYTALCCACAEPIPTSSAAADTAADTGSLDVVDTYTPAGPDTICTDVCGVIPPGGTCGGCCMQCTQGSTCVGGFCKCPASGCTSDAWGETSTGDAAGQQCPTSHFDPDCGPCTAEFAEWCGKNNAKCFCGNDYCGGNVISYSTPHFCDSGTVCVGATMPGIGGIPQCLPPCKDECDPMKGPACDGATVVECTQSADCAKVQKYACPSGKCVGGACQ